MKTTSIWLALIFIFQSVCIYASSKQAIGWLEPVVLDNGKIQMIAKIDTGADTSSINAKILNTFNLNGDDWINFELINKQGQHFSLQRKVLRYAKIKRKKASSVKRPVIELDVCLGNIHRNIEVNLAQRTNFDYQILIGQNFLNGFFMVDVEKQYITQTNCHSTELIKNTGNNDV